jgi:GT2 family glycosyltransferase
MSAPSVAVVIPTYNGAEHLVACLESLAELRYAGDVETIVVDNASTDGTRDLLARRFPNVRVVELDDNFGFGVAVNAGARASAAELVAFLNNDMRVAPGWLSELVAAYDPEAGYPCVAGVILDWEGERVDFVGGWINFHGAAGQEHYGEPVESVAIADRDVPFPCGGSMLIERRLFLELGGFDPAFFALVEDVDLGWRLWLAGHKVRLAAAARSLHRHSATTGSLSIAERNFLSERNALRMLIKNLDDRNVAPVLAASLFLLAERASLGDSGPQLRAASAVLADLDAVMDERARVQEFRRRSDDEVFAVFGEPLVAVRSEDAYLEASARLGRAFGLETLFREGTGAFAGGAPAATEPVGQALAKWRLEYGVGRPAFWHLRRTIWHALPLRLRRRLRHT